MSTHPAQPPNAADDLLLLMGTDAEGAVLRYLEADGERALRIVAVVKVARHWDDCDGQWWRDSLAGEAVVLVSETNDEEYPYRLEALGNPCGIYATLGEARDVGDATLTEHGYRLLGGPAWLEPAPAPQAPEQTSTPEEDEAVVDALMRRNRQTQTSSPLPPARVETRSETPPEWRTGRRNASWPVGRPEAVTFDRHDWGEEMSFTTTESRRRCRRCDVLREGATGRWRYWSDSGGRLRTAGRCVPRAEGAP